jgi:hypothetical protein
MSLLLIISFGCNHTNDAQNHYSICVTLSGECFADIRVFDADTVQIRREYYDCNHLQALRFNLPSSGIFIVSADNNKTVLHKSVTVKGTDTNVFFEFQ